MTSINKVIILGRNCNNFQIRNGEYGQYATLSVATSIKWKDRNTGEYKENTEFHNIFVTGSTVDYLEKYLSNGCMLYVEGSLSTKKQNDKQFTNIVVSQYKGNIQIVGGKSNDNNTSNDNTSSEVHDDIPF